MLTVEEVVGGWLRRNVAVVVVGSPLKAMQFGGMANDKNEIKCNFDSTNNIRTHKRRRCCCA